jgi:Flp pilus assembly protein TadG
MFHASKRNKSQRRGAILLLTALMIVLILGMIAFAVDTGYILVAKTQLQTAADSAALAGAAKMGFGLDQSNLEAIRFAELNDIGTSPVHLSTSDIVYGTWETSTRQFTPSESGIGNAIKVTVKADGTVNPSIPLFFGRVFDKQSVNAQVSAIATTNPRDICFVVDLSSSMNDDTDPDCTATINASYPGAGTTMMQNLFSDLGYGSYPGTTGTDAGATLFTFKSGSPQVTYNPCSLSAFYDITSTSKSPLLYKRQPITVGSTTFTIPSQYQIFQTGDGSGQTPDTTSTAKKKAYSWVMDVQIPALMPNVKPTPNSTVTNNYNYWYRYINENLSDISYKSYVAAVEPFGCDKPYASGSPSSTLYSPLSINSPDCAMHSESTDGGTFSFPPREMPTHSARRSMISAIQVIKERNQIVSNLNQRDWVSIVTYDLKTNSVVKYSLNGDYDAAMLACTQIQSCGANTSCTASETGLMTATTHLNTVGRSFTNKVVVLLTDGKPNLYSTSNTNISNYRNANPNSNFYGGSSYYAQDACIMQTSMMYGNNWIFFPIGLGMQGDEGFLDRMYSVGKGKTSETNTSPYVATGDPTSYETQLHDLFYQIISTPRIRLVQ